MTKPQPVHASVTTTIVASPETVYDLISDVTRMGEWSPETVSAGWLDDATAVAIAMADSASAGLAALETVTGLDGYHHFHGARAELLLRDDRPDEARAAYLEALQWASSPAERRHLTRRLAELPA